MKIIIPLLYSILGILFSSCGKVNNAKKHGLESADNNTAYNTSNTEALASPPLQQTSIALPVGKKIRPASESLEDANQYNGQKQNEKFYLNSVFQTDAGQSWAILVTTKTTKIVHETGRRTHDTGGSYGPYADEQLILLHSILSKFIEWDGQAKASLPQSFNKLLPFQASDLWCDEGFNSIPKESAVAEYRWINEGEEESKQDSFGSALSTITGDATKESGASSTLHFEISSHDRAWGNNLTASEVVFFKTAIEQVTHCRSRFIELNAEKQSRIAQDKAKEEKLKSQFK